MGQISPLSLSVTVPRIADAPTLDFRLYSTVYAALMSTENHMKIGELARRGGVSADTVRYYERAGLLPKPRRRASGYRDYDDETVRELRFIRSAKALGFTLEDIRELLALSTDRDKGVTGVKQRAEARLAVIEEKLAKLQRMRDGLETLIDNCPGHGALDECPILHALSDFEEQPES